jgi:ribosomal protein S18 acetylase RimI-like enzyme
VDVRRLGPGDEAVLAELAERDKGGSAGAGELAGMLARDDRVVVAAFESGRAVGWAYGYVLERPDADPPMLLLYEIGVDEAFRRRGAAAGLVGALRAFARERGLSKMWVLTDAANEAAMALYASTGGVRLREDDVLFTYRPV